MACLKRDSSASETCILRDNWPTVGGSVVSDVTSRRIRAVNAAGIWFLPLGHGEHRCGHTLPARGDQSLPEPSLEAGALSEEPFEPPLSEGLSEEVLDDPVPGEASPEESGFASFLPPPSDF